MKRLLDKIEARQQLVRETAGQLREQIALLTEQLAAAESTLERLNITRATMLELATEDGIEPPEPLPPGYREVLAAFEQAGHGLRAKEICEMLGIGTEPRHTESIRAKLKRLVDRDILAEPEPGLFTLTQPAPATPDTNSN
jgi:DNA polymerase/3'-5' exonuclease PolX